MIVALGSWGMPQTEIQHTETHAFRAPWTLDAIRKRNPFVHKREHGQNIRVDFVYRLYSRLCRL